MHLTGLPIETVAWIGAFAAVAITVLYLMRLRPRSIEVPFSPLWTRLDSQRETNENRRRLKRLVSWLVHLTIAALLVGAALGPHIDEEVVDERHVLILVDNSASMGATDVTGAHNRFELARDHALELLDTIGGDDRVMVATFDDRVRPLGPFVDDPSLLAPRLNDQSLTANPADFSRALQFATDSLREREPAELIVISDGAGLDDDPGAAMEFGDATTVRHRVVGNSSDNVAITTFSARRYPASRLDQEVLVEVRSYFDHPVDATLELTADGRLIDERSLVLQPDTPHRAVYPDLAASGERLVARVNMPRADARDVFPLDNRAYAIIEPPRRLDVRVVTEGNLYLEGPLLIADHLNVDTVAPDEYDSAADYDVTILDGVEAGLPDTGDLLYFAPSPDSSPFEIAEQLDGPIITDTDSDHPLMRWIDLSSVNIARTAAFTTAPDDTVIADAFGSPVVVARDKTNRRKVAVGFDLRETDFPLRVGFPVFLLNVIDYFADDDRQFSPPVRTGSTGSIPVEDDVNSAELIDPNDRHHRVHVHAGRANFYADTPGFHRLETSASTQIIAVNLAAPRESDIAPQTLQLEETAVEPDTDDLLFERRRIWLGMLVAALAVLLVEWMTFHRRWTV